MSKEIIIVDNLKCGGCANTISKRLNSLSGMKAVDVELDESRIEVEYDESTSKEAILKELAQMGYPERGTGNLLQKAKSYVSCAIGRLDN